VITSSGTTTSPYFVPVRSAIVETVSVKVPPPDNEMPLLAVDRPKVCVPKLRVSGRARNAMTVASPELATAQLVNTATRGFWRKGRYGLGTATATVPAKIDALSRYPHQAMLPSGSTKAPASPSPCCYCAAGA